MSASKRTIPPDQLRRRAMTFRMRRAILTCERCGTMFRHQRQPAPYSVNRFCSRECNFAQRDEKKAERETQYREQQRQWRHRRCVLCRREFESERALHCSDECQRERNRLAAKDSYVSVRVTNPGVEKECPHCGAVFSSNFYASRRRYCSARCGERYTKQQRRLRKRQAFEEAVGLAYVLRRDRGRCADCGRKVDRRRQVPHPDAPTIDHILPLSVGGVHARHNVRLLHFICNSRRSNTGPAQLRLPEDGGVRSL